MQVDTMADALMPPGVRSLRQMLHATAVEVLLYLTQLHCQEMLDSLVASLNLQYQKFLRRNPTFEVAPCYCCIGQAFHCYELALRLTVCLSLHFR